MLTSKVLTLHPRRVVVTAQEDVVHARAEAVRTIKASPLGVRNIRGINKIVNALWRTNLEVMPMPRMRTLTVVTMSVFGKSTITIGAVALVVLLHAAPVPIWPAQRRSTNGVVTLGHFGLHAANVAAATLLKSPEEISFS